MTKDITQYSVYDVSDPVKPRNILTGSMEEVAKELEISEHYARNALTNQNKVKWRYIIRKEEY